LVASTIETTPHKRRFKKVTSLKPGFFDKWPENKALKYKMKDVPENKA